MDDPFDARKVLLTDGRQPTCRWRTVSLVTALRAALLEGAPIGGNDGDQVLYLRQVADELTARGIDGDSIIRYGLSPELLAAVVVRALQYWIPALRVLHEGAIEQEDPDPQPAVPWPHPQTWEELLGAVIESEGDWSAADDFSQDAIGKSVRAIFEKVYPWTLSAPVSELLALKPPTVEQLHAAGSVPVPDMSTLEEYRWTIDRFSGTRLQDWSTSSLHREYKWRQGTWVAPCPEDLMHDRVVDGHELNDEIARRAVGAELPKHDGDPTGLNRTLLAKLSSSAIELLRINRSREAAALFEFAVSESPYNAELLNNFGFCLIAHDPRRALSRLEEAQQRGYSHPEINLYNRALCKLLLGDGKVALTMIDDYWENVHGEPALLWRLDANGLQLRLGANSRDEMAYLGFRAAKVIGDVDSMERWLATGLIGDDPEPSS